MKGKARDTDTKIRSNVDLSECLAPHTPVSGCLGYRGAGTLRPDRSPQSRRKLFAQAAGMHTPVHDPSAIWYSVTWICTYVDIGSSEWRRKSTSRPHLKEGQGLINPFNIYVEKETATHSSILAWRIPWTKEPSGLSSMGSQRVRPIERLSLAHSTCMYRVVLQGTHWAWGLHT